MCFELSNQKTNNYAQITKNKQLKKQDYVRRNRNN